MVVDPASADDRLSEIETNIELAKAENTKAEPARERRNQTLDDFARSQRQIATWVIMLYIGLILLVALTYVATAIWPRNPQVAVAADRMRDLTNTLVIPIVTLVLGYYFGKRAG